MNKKLRLDIKQAAKETFLKGKRITDKDVYDTYTFTNKMIWVLKKNGYRKEREQ